MKDDDAPAGSHGVLQSAIEVFLDSTRSVTELVTRAGSAGARAVVPDPVLASLDRMLLSLRSVVEQFPHMTDEIDVLVGELNAKRLSVQALTAELDVLDRELEILQGTLAPIQAWSRQWSQMQRSLLHALETTAPRDPEARSHRRG
ncbi:MAG: hypothetical protein ABI776_02780 [Nocardioidaceae bacterium]